MPVYIYADIDAIAQKIQDDFDGQNIDLLLEGPIQIAYPESNVICSGEAKETYEEEIVSCLKLQVNKFFLALPQNYLAFVELSEEIDLQFRQKKQKSLKERRTKQL